MKITLIKGANVFAPEHRGVCDVVVAGNKIIDIGSFDEDSLSKFGASFKIIQAENHILMPGIVDCLVHVSGGGGEGGFHTRTPELRISDAIQSGVTCLVSALGTDAVSRSLEDMLAKVKAIKHYGLSSFCYAGNYHLPALTISGDLKKDIMMIEEIIGVGELAIADHRGSQIQAKQLAELAASARVAGMLSGKSGIVFIHVGPSRDGLEILHEVVDRYDLKPSQFLPTHMNRNEALLNQGIRWAKRGGHLDFTTSTNEHFVSEGEIPAAKAVAMCLEQGVDISQLSLSSDGNASLPVFDSSQNLIGLEVGKVQSLFESFKEMVLNHKVPIDLAIAAVTQSPARVLGLKKGCINIGNDADLVLIEQNSFEITDVFAMGNHLIDKGEITVAPSFE